MRTAAPLQAATAKPALSGVSLSGRLLQRKCASGGSSGPSGECEECRKKKMQGIQTKLAIGEPNDAYEQEADRIADQVMATPAGLAVSSAPPRIQRLVGQPTGHMDAAPASVDQVLASPGRPLEPALRQDMEQRFGYDFSQVRVHSGAAAEQSAQDVNAHAYTVGQNIVFGTGRFIPETREGRRLIAHELTHVVQQRGSGAVIHRKEQGSGLDDPLYMADRKWSSGQGPDDRVTGQRLSNWAIARGSMVIRSDDSMMRMQEKDGVEPEIVDDILLLLIDLLRGFEPRRQPRDTSHIVIGGSRASQRAPYDAAPGGKLDRFEGSDHARESAVLELLDMWEPIASYLTSALSRRYTDEALEAFGRTPKGFELETDTAEVKRVRRNPSRHKALGYAPLGGVNVVRVGDRFGRWRIADIHDPDGDGSGQMWVVVEGHPLWLYRGTTGALNYDTFVGEVARGVADQAKFAGMLFPMMIKAGGFALSFSPNPVMILAGAVFEEFGEEGIRDLTGEGRSFRDVSGDVAKQVLVDLVFGKLVGGGGHGVGAGTDAARALERVAERTAAEMRTAVRKEIVQTEGPDVVRAIEGGAARPVGDGTLRAEGFVDEIHIQHSGGGHTYRRKADGTWCRWSKRRLCDVELPDATRALEGRAGGRISSDPYPSPSTSKSVLEVKGGTNLPPSQKPSLPMREADKPAAEIHTPPASPPVRVDPRARGYAVEDRRMDTLKLESYEPLPDWFKTHDAIRGGEVKTITERGQTIKVIKRPDAISIKSTSITEPAALTKKVTADIERLRGGFEYTRGGVRVEGVRNRRLDLIFEEGANITRETISTIERLQREAGSVRLRWFVVKGTTIYPGPQYFREVARVLE